LENRHDTIYKMSKDMQNTPSEYIVYIKTRRIQPMDNQDKEQ